MSYALHSGLHGHGMDTLSRTLSRPRADPDQGRCWAAANRPSPSTGCPSTRRRLRRRGCRHHAAALASLQAAPAPGPRHHRLRDAGTPAGPGAGTDGTARHQGRPRHAERMSGRSPRRWPRWRPRSTKWRARIQRRNRPSSWARSCSTSWLRGRQEGQDRRLCHRRRRARGSGDGTRPARPGARLAAGGQAQIHLHGCVAGPHPPRYGPRAHLLRPDRGGTGRLSSTDPNLQNIPVRSEEGRRIREAFVAEPGHVLLSLDYSQIELRILAHVADLPALKQAFADGQDIHAMTASEMFDVPLDEMTPETRRRPRRSISG